MSNYNNNITSITSTNDRFELLKRQYEIIHNNKDIHLSEEAMKEDSVVNTISSLNAILNNKLAEIKQARNNIDNLEKYKTEITDILTTCKDMESKYIKLYGQNSLNSLEIKLQEPLPPRSISLKESLLGDLRDQPIIETIYDEMKTKSFIVNESYIHNMCEIIEKVNIKIIEETLRMESLSAFINNYKSIMSNCADKQILNRFKCTICFENEVKICVTPCGHTFCNNCSKKLDKKCFACNGSVRGKTTLFFLGKEEEDDGPTSPDTVQPYRPNGVIR